MSFTKKLYWKGYNYADRPVAVHTVESTVKPWGAVVDYKMFSDMVVTLTIEIEACKVDALYAELKPVLDLEDSPPIQMDSDIKIQIFLNMTFVPEPGDTETEVLVLPT
jgi:hypothetical protein